MPALQKGIPAACDATDTATKPHLQKTNRYVNFPRIGCASMLGRRELYNHNGPYFRFIVTDKGPQRSQSMKLLNTVEICVARSDVEGRSLLQIDPAKIFSRKLAPSTMLQGGTDLPCTVRTLLHHNFLDYGPSRESMRSSLDGVIGLGSDLGTESGVADYHDVLSNFLSDGHCRYAGQYPSSVEPSHIGSFLFPSALKGTGPLHCIDWIISSSCNKSRDFPEYSKHVKALLQHLHGRKVGVAIASSLKTKGLTEAELIECKGSMSTGGDHFADWRWSSLHRADNSMSRYKKPIITLSGEIYTGRNTKAQEAFQYALSEHCWSMRDAISLFVAPLMHLHGWIQGKPLQPFDPHDEQKPKKVNGCPFQGLSCALFSQRLQETICEFERIRDAIRPSAYWRVDIAILQDICGFIIAMSSSSRSGLMTYFASYGRKVLFCLYPPLT